MSEPVNAIWTLGLNCECPNCKKLVNLLDDPDFWDGRKMGYGETGTMSSTNAAVGCPECGAEFKANFQY